MSFPAVLTHYLPFLFSCPLSAALAAKTFVSAPSGEKGAWQSSSQQYEASLAQLGLTEPHSVHLAAMAQQGALQTGENALTEDTLTAVAPAVPVRAALPGNVDPEGLFPGVISSPALEEGKVIQETWRKTRVALKDKVPCPCHSLSNLLLLMFSKSPL